MNFGQIGAGLAAMYPGVLAGREGEAKALTMEMQAQAAQESQQADVVRGKALMDLFSGSGQPSPTPPMPGQPSVPAPRVQMAAAPAPGVPGAPFPTPAGPRPSPAPPAPMGPMDSQPAPVTAPQPAPQAPGPSTTGAGGPQLAGVGEQNGKPTIGGGVPNGPLTWQMIGSAIARANPGAPPQLIAKAIDRFVPMMTQDSQLQWRLIKMQQDEKLLGIKEEGKNQRSANRESNLNDRASFMRDLRREERASRSHDVEVTNETRMATAALSAETRKIIADLHDNGANQRLLTQLQARDDWKKLDHAHKTEVTDMIIAGQREREEMRQEGQAARTTQQQTGATERTRMQQEGAAARNQNTTATALELGRQRTELAKWIADGKPITATQSRISEKSQSYDSATSTIDQALQDVAQGHKTGADVVGLKGKALGVYEIAGNIGGWTDQTRRAAFEQKISALLNTVPRLLTGSTITNKDERLRMGQIIQGLTPGSTKQATVHDLVWLKGKLAELKPALGANTNQGDIRATRPAAPVLKPMTPEAKAAMDAALADGHPRADVEKMLRDKGFDPASEPPKE